MPDPIQTDAQRAAQIARPGELFKDAPAGADLDLDSLFPNPEQPVQAAEPVAATPVQPEPVATPEPFMQVPTGTLYKTKEEAIRGYEEKDRYIAKLRQDLLDAQGKIPQPVQTPQPDPSDALYDELANAAEKRDKRGYVAAQAKLIESVLAPYAPLLAEVARERAIRQAEVRSPGVREFMASDTYKQLGERLPLIRDAITQLEHNPQAAQAQLDQLFEIAKLASDGLRMPELLKTQAAAPPPAPVVAQTPRPILTSTTATPTAETSSYNPRDTEAMLSTVEGRKALLEAYRRRGVDQVRLESVRL